MTEESIALDNGEIEILIPSDNDTKQEVSNYKVRPEILFDIIFETTLSVIIFMLLLYYFHHSLAIANGIPPQFSLSYILTSKNTTYSLIIIVVCSSFILIFLYQLYHNVKSLIENKVTYRMFRFLDIPFHFLYFIIEVLLLANLPNITINNSLFSSIITLLITNSLTTSFLFVLSMALALIIDSDSYFTNRLGRERRMRLFLTILVLLGVVLVISLPLLLTSFAKGSIYYLGDSFYNNYLFYVISIFFYTRYALLPLIYKSKEGLFQMLLSNCIRCLILLFYVVLYVIVKSDTLHKSEEDFT